jgi:hypothetical protein
MINRLSLHLSVFSIFSVAFLSAPASGQFWKRRERQERSEPTQHRSEHSPPRAEAEPEVRRALPVGPPPVLARLQMVPNVSTAGGDSHYGNTQLIATRNQHLTGVDACAAVGGQKNFLSAIEGGVRMSLVDRKIESNHIIDEAYGLPGTEDSHPVSLISNELCVQDEAQIAAILGDDFVPNSQTVQALKNFAQASNEDRRRALAGDNQALAAFTTRWTQFMGCLAYSESLQTADSEGVDQRFQNALNKHPTAEPFFQNTAGQTVRPQGVLIHEDRQGEFFIELRKAAAEGSLNAERRAELEKQFEPWPVVGMFQFDPKFFGNVAQCVHQWNKIVDKPECKIEPRSTADILRALASPGQTFNTFCGAQKIVQAFNSQVNTNMATGVDTSNILPGGRIKAPKDRCVSLVARSGRGRIYSHFGPLRNSVKDNLGRLMGCVANAAP